MNDNKLSFLYSWPAIIIAFFVFWPVGLFLLFKRVANDKKTAMGAAKLIRGIGIASCVFAAIGFLASFSDDFGSALIVVLIFGGAGVALISLAKKMKTEAENVKKYLAIIVNGNERMLDNIASAIGKDYATVRSDVQKLIDKGYLKNAYINENAREVVLPVKAAPAPVYTAATPNAPAAPVQVRVVTCPCCGANNTIAGAVGECEYCGAPLK